MDTFLSTLAALGVAGLVALCIWQNHKRRVRKLVPRESIRSLITEGVIKVTVAKKGYDDYTINVESPIPLKHETHNGYMVLSYIDGSSRTKVTDENLGSDALTIA